jgi:Nup93/Nic96
MDWRTLAQTDLPTVNPQASYRPTPSYHGQDSAGGGGLFAGGSSSSGGPPPPPPARIVPLEVALELHEQAMLDFILTKAEEDTRKSMSKLIEDHVQKNWEMQRDRWLEGLSNYSTTPHSSSHQQQHPYYHHEGPNLLAIGGGGGYQQSNSNASMIDSGLSASNRHHDLLLTAHATGSLDFHQVRAHCAIVRNNLLVGQQRGQTTSAAQMIEEFTNLSVQSSSSGQLPPPQLHEYVSAWKIVALFVGSGAGSSPAERARRTALALGYRFRESIMARLLPQQQQQQQSSTMGDMKQQAVEFQNTFVMGDPSSWPAVYFCLRVGDAKAAQAIIEQRSSFDFDPAVASLINGLATSQGQADSVWEANLDYLFLDGHKVVAVKDLLETMKGNPNHNKYEAGVYSLLAGATPVLSETLEGFKTTEDYAYTSIGIVLLHAADTTEGLADLSKEIIQQGPSHFRSASSWEYFLPLIAAQQYHRAFDWLMQVAPIQATHLALGFRKANVPIQNHGEADLSEETMAGILIKYATLMDSPEAALTYLALISDKSRARSEMARIVANQPDITLLAGTMNAVEGKRVGGVLAEIVASREELSEILVAAASLLRVQKGDRKNIVLCLTRAERFDEVLATLNSFLVPVDKPDEHRGFWVDNTKFFLRDFVDISPSPVEQNLAKANKLGILEETRLLVRLNDLIAGGQSNLMEGLELLPRSQDEFDHKKRRFDDFSAAVQGAYGPLLMLRMRALADEHADLKRQLGGFNAGSTHQSIQHNELLSDLYIRFAEAINVPAKERQEITQLGYTII